MQRLGEAWFAYNGKQCAQMGLRLLRMPVRRAAERLGERAQALGRDGYLWMDGGAYAPVEIEAGEGNILCADSEGIRMIHADCPDQLCVKQGKIGSGNLSIVCLPNRVTVILKNAESGWDGVAG